MSTRSWIRDLFVRTPRPARRATTRFRPTVQAMEDRLTPATFTVNTLADENNGFGVGNVSLREAITQANSQAGDDTIQFGVTGTINLTGPLPGLNSNININGPAGGLTVRRDTGGDYGIFRVGSATVSLSGLTIANGQVSVGAGIYNDGTLTVSNSNISGNVAWAWGEGFKQLPIQYGFGAGIYNRGTVTVSNSTLSGNHAANEGGGVYNLGTLTVTSCTLSDNLAYLGGGILNRLYAVTTLSNTIVANSTGGDVANGEYVGQLGFVASTLSGSHNLIESGLGLDGLAGTITADPMLGQLQNNGGPTPTRALPPGSPATDKGSSALVPAGVTTDQRGFARVVGTAVDIGAFEVPPNQAPTGIGLSGGSVAENQPAGTTVGTFTTTDPDTGDTFTYTLVGGTGSTDNASFTTAGNLLKTAAGFNYEAKSSFSIRVRSTDVRGLWTENAFTVGVTNVNEPPTLVALGSPGVTVNEGSKALNSITFSDPDSNLAGATPTVGSLTPSPSAPGSWIWSYTPPDSTNFPTTVTIFATDTAGLTTTASFSLTVNNVAPTINGISIPATSAEGSPVTLSATATDPANRPGAAPDDPLIYTWTVTGPGGITLATVTAPSFNFTPPDNGTYCVRLTVTDGDGGTTHYTPAGLVSWWHGDGNAGDVKGSNNGTLVGGATFATGKFGQAFNFNGTNRVEAADSPSLDLTAAVTVEAWVNPATLSFNNGFGAIIAKSGGVARNYGLYVRSDGGLHLSYINTSGVNVILDSPAGLVPAGQFSHLAAVIDPAGGVMRIYRNGQQVASRTPNGPLVANAVPLTIGFSDPGYDFGFRGLIDEPAVYGRALGSSEILALANASSAGKFTPVAVANVAPTLTFSSPSSGLAGQVLTFTVGANDPSSADFATGFTYTINWGDGSAVQTINPTANNGSGVGVTHKYLSPGTYTITVTAIDDDGGSFSITRSITIV